MQVVSAKQGINRIDVFFHFYELKSSCSHLRSCKQSLPHQSLFFSPLLTFIRWKIKAHVACHVFVPEKSQSVWILNVSSSCFAKPEN